MSRRLQAEVDKLTKEVNVNIEAYDTRWQELKDFNRSQLGLKERMWEEARREQIRGKKHAVRTATLELLDFKHVCDSKGRIETDLETILRRLHRHKQQLTEWSCAPDLRQQANELRDLRKQVELRYKRGRVFYCRGESSEQLPRGDPNAPDEPTEEGLEQLEWCEAFLKSLQKQKEEFEEECKDLKSPNTKRRQPPTSSSRNQSPHKELNARESRRSQLETFIQLHETHCQRLNKIITAITTQGYTIGRGQAQDLRDELHQYVENNDNLEYVVAEDIYMELDLPSSSTESVLQEDPSSSSSSDHQVESNSSCDQVVTEENTIQQTTVRRMQEIICVDTAVCDWSFSGQQHPDQTTLSVKAGDRLYVVRIDKSGWSYALKLAEVLKANQPPPCDQQGDHTHSADDPTSPLSPRHTHIDASHPNVVSRGWFPNHVRKSVHDWSLDQPNSVTEASIISAVTSTPRNESANLLERLQTLQQEEAQICCANLTWLLSSLTCHIRPESVCVIQWNWSQSWELASRSGSTSASSVRYLDVSKGDRVWVLRLSPESDWAEVRKLDDWDYRAVGWIPTTNLVSPREIVDNLILLDNITAPLKPTAPTFLGPLHCYDDRH